MPTGFIDLDRIERGIHARWGPRDWKLRFPWWAPPSRVRILFYADSGVQLVGGGFGGLQHVYSVMSSQAYPYVDFGIDVANRDGTDPSATIPGAKKLTDLDIVNQYDEIFFFGYDSGGDLDPDEHVLLEQFMGAPKFGGVLVTGDHANLGRRLAGQIKRAGKMRQYPAPDAGGPQQNTTLVDGPDAGSSFDFDDQSDDTPQVLRLRQYPIGPASPFRRRHRPHPVMCGPDGPITLFPDHEHEGEALAPAVAAADPAWPSKAGHQERPEVIAWGRIKDPAADRHGQEIGVVSAYDGHNVDVGRIIADSTWHHWFDINLLGAASSGPYAGFDATPGGQAALEQIDAYFLNVGVWLAPPARQAEMRAATWWSVLWDSAFLELPVKPGIAPLGELALDALGRRAPRCTVSRWVFEWPIFKEKIPRWEWQQLFDKLQLVDLPFERYVAGGIAARLLADFGPVRNRAFPDKAPEIDQLHQSMSVGVEEGLKAFSEDLRRELQMASRFVESGFDVKQALG